MVLSSPLRRIRGGGGRNLETLLVHVWYCSFTISILTVSPFMALLLKTNGRTQFVRRSCEMPVENCLAKVRKNNRNANCRETKVPLIGLF